MDLPAGFFDKEEEERLRDRQQGPQQSMEHVPLEQRPRMEPSSLGQQEEQDMRRHRQPGLHAQVVEPPIGDFSHQGSYIQGNTPASPLRDREHMRVSTPVVVDHLETRRQSRYQEYMDNNQEEHRAYYKQPEVPVEAWGHGDQNCRESGPLKRRRSPAPMRSNTVHAHTDRMPRGPGFYQVEFILLFVNMGNCL